MVLNIKTNVVSNMITGVILLVILFQVGADLIPEAQSAGNELNGSGIPLGNLFTSGGVVFVLIAAALILVVLNSMGLGGQASHRGKRRKR